MVSSEQRLHQHHHKETESRAHFLQARHRCYDTILVALRCTEDVLDILSWAINVAARPGDAVIAFSYAQNQGAKTDDSISKLPVASCQDHAKLTALKDICTVKQVKLDIRFATGNNYESELTQQALSILPSMLVIRPSNRHERRNLKKTGNAFANKMTPGCFIVIIKEHKVLYHREIHLKDCSTDPPEQVIIGPSSVQSFQMNHEDLTIEKECNAYITVNSPRGVLDGLGFLSESDASSQSTSNNSALSHSLSKKGILSCVSSPRDDEEVVSNYRAENSLILKKSRPIHRLSTFPQNGRIKKCSGAMDCSVMRSSFKSYMNTLCSTESMSHDPCAPTYPLQQNWRCFSHEELVVATNNFNCDNIVGKGGHAEVYRGILTDGHVVAVKRLTKKCNDEAKEKDFLTELGIIGHVSHPNTISLIGFCVEDGLYLIFDFSSHGSLATLLHGVEASLLDWSVRYKVAVGTARGLHYLHTGCPRRIIHRDIKASNILLGHEFEPKISDFGLAKWLPQQWTQLSVFPVEGTFGYLAPECFMHGMVNEKTDVFAFGVLLLELITGREPIDDSRQSLVIWSRPLLETGKLEELVDPKLAGVYNAQQLKNMVMAAGLCVQPCANNRPYMNEVLEVLTNEQPELHTHISFSRSDCYQDSCEEYDGSNYINDLSRHREVALQF